MRRPVAGTSEQYPAGLLLDSSRRVPLSNYDSSSVAIFATEVPFAKPGRVRALKVKGKAKASKRRVDWSAPAVDGGGPIESSKVVVKKRHKTLPSRSSGARRRR